MRFRCLMLSILMLAFAAVPMACGVVFAADTLPAHAPAFVSPAPAALASFLTDTVFPVIGAALLGFFTLLMNQVGQKYKIQTLTDKNSLLFKLAAQGIALAEEHAAKLAGSISALTGSEKLDIAVAHILSFFPKIDPGHAQDIVHSVLAQIPGAGATGEAVTLLPTDGGYSIPVPPVPEEDVPIAVAAAA